MTRSSLSIIAGLVLAVAAGASLHAQDAPAPAAQRNPQPTISEPLKVQVVITRFQGDKKVASLPYTLSVIANDPRQQGSSIRMGAQVPIVSRPAPADNKDAAPPTVQYRDVGTSIDCYATSLDGRFRLNITIDDSSVLGDEPSAQQGLASGRPSFRSFRSSETLLLKDGQSAQYTTATDKVNGEVVKVDVTLTVLK